jgi:hypothetical protein
MTTVQPAATAEASLAQRNSAFAFQGVIRPATPTGSMVTVVLPQIRTNGKSWSAFSAARDGVVVLEGAIHAACFAPALGGGQ